ncbi:MAG: enoyl-CoA hydratase [Candidatus Marinimicrobia bacterium]|jgi:methylglutaconyl-CoA hydratase|nr:enoyl-CoA hydratase [Candidatus Neomarinimicrobiota bacterium]
MNYDFITLEINNDIAHVSLNRPELRNAMNLPILKELRDCFHRLSSQDDVRIVVLRGKGKSFCAGADIKHMKDAGRDSADKNQSDSQYLADMYEAVNTCSKPVVAVVHGHAFGGGFGLCNVCDIVIAEENTIFALSEVLIGIIPAVIGPYTIEKIGLSTFRALGISGERFDGKHAEKIGLVQYAIPENEVEKTLEEILKQLKKGSPQAQATFKNYLQNMDTLDAKDVISDIRSTKEGQEGLSAFLERRKPKWIKE